MFNKKTVEQQRADPSLPQRYQSRASKTEALVGSVFKRPPMPPASVIVRENERESRDFRAILLQFCVRNGRVDTGKARGRSRAICGAPWHRNVSKRGHFFS